MNYRHLFPVLRLLLPFMAGIAVSVLAGDTLHIPAIIPAVAALATILAAILLSTVRKFGREWIFGVLLNITLLTGGFVYLKLHTGILQNDHFSKTATSGTFVAEVTEPLQAKEHSYKTILEVKSIKKGNSLLPCRGRILAYFAKDSLHAPPEAGSTIVISAELREIAPPQNPGSFDYKKYMASSDVYHQVYINQRSWKTIQKPAGTNIFLVADRIRNYFVNTLKNNNLSGKELAVAAALMLGQRDQLDFETMQDYSGSGVIHILSVSGLHVGVIFLVINFLLGFLSKKRWQQFFKAAVIILTIWAYAVLTGLSPSVSRAALMFTFITLGNMSSRYVHIINSLSVSAFVLMLINPWVITNIGFQLSYLAIIGIVALQKPVASLWKPKNRILENTWELVAVSIAAQIVTAPLSVYYFHQFPNYFIPANLVAVPLSSLVIYSGLSVLATSFIPVVSNFFGTVTSFLLYIMNSVVGYIESLPYSVQTISNVFAREMLLLYFLLIMVFLAFTLKRKIFLYAAMVSVILISASFAVTAYTRQSQAKLIVYQLNRHTALSFVKGRQQVLLSDTVVLNDKKLENYQFKATRNALGISKTSLVSVDTLGKTLYYDNKLNMGFAGKHLLFGNKRIVLVDSIPRNVQSNSGPLPADFLVLYRNPKLKIADLLKLYKPGVLIIDNTCSEYKTAKWLEECRQLKLPAHSIRKNGAYLADLL